MSEQKKPQAGEWWFANDGGGRCYIVGHRDDGRAVVQFVPRGDMMVDFDGLWNHWHHEPRCNSWEWQPEPEPKWFDLTAMDHHVLREGIDHVSKGDRFAPVFGLHGKTISVAKQFEYTQFRCLLKDAPPEYLKPAGSPEVCAMCGKQGTDGCKDCTKYAIESTGCPVESEWPKYYTSNPLGDPTIAYIIRDSPSFYRMMEYLGTISPNVHHWLPFDDQTRTQITKEQADAILDEKRPRSDESAYGYCPVCGARGKLRERRINGNDVCENGHLYPSKDAIYGDATPAAEDHDEWVTQDRVPMRGCVDQRRWVDRHGAAGHWGEDWLTTVSHGYTTGSGHRLELRCRRRDLPPIPEPKPATQTIVFHECIVKQGCPPDYYTLEWVSDVPKHSNWIPTGRTETREVVR